MRWLALSSFSGTELDILIQWVANNYSISNIYVDETTAITNNPNSKLLDKYQAKLIPNRPTSEEYKEVFGDPTNTIITLHGWNRIIPADICDMYTIYNVHPGDIVNYPFLKGADPQQKAIDMKLQRSGVVIHKCSAEVDSGEIVAFQQTNISGLNIDQVTSKLREISIQLWINFLQDISK